jgi:hypothetical protein
MVSKATLARAGALAAAVVLGLPVAAAAQFEDVPRPAAYALQNVTVVQADGRMMEGVTVVVRGALIEAMGTDVAVPADAEVLDGDSLRIYPGLIDGNGDADFEFPDPDIDRNQVELWNAPRSLQGFMPHRRLVDYLTDTGEDVASQRKEGIVAAAVHPAGAMMPGRGALLMYRMNAGTPGGLVLQPTLGPKFEFRGGQGVYPGTQFGVMATMRQGFEDARHLRMEMEAYDDDPRGMTAPAYDADYDVLNQVMNGLPVYFEADDAADILRVARLSDEYGFNPVIVGGEEAWMVTDALTDRDIPVLVSVDFRSPRRWDPDADGDLDAPTEREKEAFENRYANAGRLAEAGVMFALTSGGSGEVLDGARKAVEYGLSEADALAALTTRPASIFGVPALTRLGEGLPATFIVTTGPLFGEDTRVAYTFVEGWKEDGARPGAAAGSADEAVAFGGEWSMTIDAQGQMIEGTLTIEQDGATFAGTLMMQGMPLQLRDGVINGNAISVTAVMEQGGQTMEIEIKGTVEGDQASGEADAGPLGTARWTAERKGPGGAR